MLRVLQERSFERVGGDEAIHTDVRVIAATNTDLQTMAGDGRFRQDLLFRLNVFGIPLPPLRERGTDLELLVEHFLRRYSQELNKPVRGLTPGTLALLKDYTWPGNVRELQSVLKQALLEMRGEILLPEDLPKLVRLGCDETAVSTAQTEFNWDTVIARGMSNGTTNLYAEMLELMERELLVRVLRHTQGNQLRASKILGITRGSLRTKIRTLGIGIGREVSLEDDPSDGTG
jgi:two-component system nitrogen regulation response regulator GlnG